jgi:hypothetical protein
MKGLSCIALVASGLPPFSGALRVVRITLFYKISYMFHLSIYAKNVLRARPNAMMSIFLFLYDKTPYFHPNKMGRQYNSDYSAYT